MFVCIHRPEPGFGICSNSTTDGGFFDHVVRPGTYYLHVFGANAVNIYDLWWAQDDAYEKNDTRAAAWHPGDYWESTWLSSIDGLGVQLDDDWYRIDVDSGFERVQVDLLFTHADGDIDVCLFDGFGVGLTCSTSTTDNEFIDTEVPGPGTYYIKVYYGNAGNTYDLWWSTVCLLDDVQCLISWYYKSILDRFPEAGILDSWTNEVDRIVTLGLDVKEGFISLGKLFFNSAEYLLNNKTDGQYIVDLYETFLHRTPFPWEVADWVAELEGGLTRNLLLNYFIFSDEFRTYMEGIFGPNTIRPEYSLVNDLYRGFLSRLPDDGGFNSWLALMQEAQCTGEQAVRDLTNQIGLLFLHSDEYAARGSDNSEYITDLYDAILRRGAELAGYRAWLDILNNPGMTRELALWHFISSDEFQGRVQEVIDVGCSLP
jgi:hypothetical protein